MDYDFEERIINYEEENQIQNIIEELLLEDFLLVKHSNTKKQLHFKKINSLLETNTVSDL
jgi:hypothetical protein